MPGIDLSCWMGALDGELRLNQIVLPATHDSGMSFQSWGSVYSAINPLAGIAKLSTSIIAVDDSRRSGRDYTVFHDNFVTQTSNVAGQLACGARQFDLRMTKNFNVYKAYHGDLALSFVGMRRYGETWKDICNSIAEFMKASHSSEVLILKMDKQDKSEKELVKMLSDALTKTLGNDRPHGRYTTLKKKYVDQETLDNLRGRILVCGKKKFLDACKGIPSLHFMITLCEWSKNEQGDAPEGVSASTRVGQGEYPVYLLLGSSEAGGKAPSKRANPLEKQVYMRNIFDGKSRTVGMRGIWFNTYSYLRDIQQYSTEVWADDKLRARESLWLSGKKRQNVASVDFLDQEKGEYIVRKNPSLDT